MTVKTHCEADMREISGVWRTRGFEAFRRGTFGNAGQNLYVSRAGVLQRIHLFDLNKDGWTYAAEYLYTWQTWIKSLPAAPGGKTAADSKRDRKASKQQRENGNPKLEFNRQ